ncbi:MAG: hypothetical protein GXP62_04325 [Oligoflexia bacterium]|nr:hypothetical protein [Oligoflexia bacterium]
MSALHQLLSDLLELGRHSLAGRVPLHLETTSTATAAHVREAEEVEGLGLAEPLRLSVLGREATELDQASLFWV